MPSRKGQNVKDYENDDCRKYMFGTAASGLGFGVYNITLALLGTAGAVASGVSSCLGFCCLSECIMPCIIQATCPGDIPEEHQQPNYGATGPR